MNKTYSIIHYCIILLFSQFIRFLYSYIIVIYYTSCIILFVCCYPIIRLVSQALKPESDWLRESGSVSVLKSARQLSVQRGPCRCLLRLRPPWSAEFQRVGYRVKGLGFGVWGLGFSLGFLDFGAFLAGEARLGNGIAAVLRCGPGQMCEALMEHGLMQMAQQVHVLSGRLSRPSEAPARLL